MKRVKDHRYLYRREGVLYFRRAMPLRARVAFDGQSEVQQSLFTSDLAEARHLLAAELQKFEARLSSVTGTITPTEAIRASRRLIPSKEEIDEQVRAWLQERAARAYVGEFLGPAGVTEGRRQLAGLDTYSADVARGIEFGAAEPTQTTTWIAETIIEKNGWRLDGKSDLKRHLMRAIGRGQIEASRWQMQDIKGEARVIADATFAPDQYRLDAERQRNRREPVSLLALFEGHVAENKPAPATIKAWRRQIKAFIAFVGHDDANAVTHADVIAWKDRLLNEPNAGGKLLSARTVRDTYLSALKTAFRWGCDNAKIASNPSEKVRVKGPRRIVTRELGLTDAEAQLILAATLTDPPAKLSVERARARRWVPWLCAYTGGALSEQIS